MKIENSNDQGGSTFAAPKSNDSAHQDQQGQGFIPGKTDKIPEGELQTRVPTAQDISQDTSRNQARTPVAGEPGFEDDVLDRRAEPAALVPNHAGNNLGNVAGAGSQNRAVFAFAGGEGASFSIEREADGRYLVRAQGGVNQGGHVVLIPVPAERVAEMREALAYN